MKYASIGLIIAGLAIATTIIGDYGSRAISLLAAGIYRYLTGIQSDPDSGSQWTAADLLILAIGTILFFWLIVAALRVANKIVSSSARVTEVQEEPKRVLIMGLSLIEARSDPRPGWAKTAEQLNENARSKHLQSLIMSDDDFDNIVEDRPLKSPWQQNVQSIYRHIDRLERVLILPSEETSKQFDIFQKYISALFKVTSKFSVEMVTRSDIDLEPFSLVSDPDRKRNYDDYDYVYQGLRRALRQAGVPDSIQSSEICIDATAGIKVFSIAAAMVTLNTDVKLSYVTTTAPSGIVKFYDMRVDFAGFLG